MTEMNIEVTDVTIEHEVVELTSTHLEVSDGLPTTVVVASAGVTGPRGYSGIIASDDPPEDTDLLWADTDDDIQMTLIPGPTGPQGPVGPKGDKGDTGNTSIHELRGTGFPEGIVAAPPGTYYTDTAITNGAVRWVKTSGSGSTGWRVTYGDTGWRAIQENELNYGLTGYIANNTYRLNVRRINDVIHMSGCLGNVKTAADAALAAGVTNNALVWPAPVGFRPTGGPLKHITCTGFGGGASVRFLFRFDSAGLVIPYTNQVPPNYGSGWLETLGFPTNDAWPTTLPGTAA